MLIALCVSTVVLVVIALMFVRTHQESSVATVSELNAWDESLKTAKALRELAARCRAARGMLK